VTSTLVFEGAGQWREYEGGVQDWLTQSKRSQELARNTQKETAPQATTPAPTQAPKPTETPAKRSVKLSYKEQREWDALPGEMASLEAQQLKVRQSLNDPAMARSDAGTIQALYAQDSALEEQLLDAMARWEALSDKLEGKATQTL